VDVSVTRRLLFHLLSNALKFTSAGEVRVTVRPDSELGAAVLVVQDTGVGIAPERIADVFELFAQGDGSTTRRYAGTGMGLTLVQRCARLLGGEVVVESTPGRGSEFRVHLPGVLKTTGAPSSEPIGTLH
jgi:signal transduction histidine kinase